MCGRAAQTHQAVRAAAGLLLPNASAAEPTARQQQQPESSETEWQDNYNMSPGMTGTVFVYNGESIEAKRKVWGLVPRAGTAKAPLDPTNMSQHFSNLMFNARSDTLLEKRTFCSLFNQSRTCVVALDGFFEWKAPALKGSKKQPYYVYRKDGPCLLLAGLWTSAATGRKEPSTLDTFTIITTDSCPSLTWLHSRAPLCIWDETLAMQWLERPTPRLLAQLEEASQNTPPDVLQWHAVSTKMSSMKYRSADAIKAIPPPASVKSFFAPKGKSPAIKSKETAAAAGSKTAGKASPPSLKRSHASPETKSASKKRKSPKRGPIQSFFAPK